MTTEAKLDFYGDGADRPWVNARLVSSAIVGHTTETSVKLWVRAWTAGSYCLLVSTSEIARGLAGSRPRLKDGDPALEDASGAMLQSFDCVHLEAAVDGTTDFTHTFEIGDLAEGRQYFYALFATDDNPAHNAWELAPDPLGRTFKTLPQKRGRLTFGLVSCHMPFAKNGDVQNHTMWERLYDTLDEADADLLIACGDQVYADGNDRIDIWRWLRKNAKAVGAMPKAERIAIMRSWYRDIYRGYWGFRGLQSTFGRFPSYMIWDDHEILDGWGSYDDDELARKVALPVKPELAIELSKDMLAAARMTYIEYQGSHNPSPLASDAFDYSFDAHGAAFYVLDTRSKRDFKAKEDAILGGAQRARFLAWLDRKETADARAVFIVTSAPVVHLRSLFGNHLDLELLTIEDDIRDQWEHESHWAERDALLEAVFSRSASRSQPIVFLSGDVHVGAGFQLTTEKHERARVFQVTSSPITRATPAIATLLTKNSGALGGAGGIYHFTRLDVVGQNNFCIVRLEGPDTDLRLTFNLYNRQPEDEHIVKRQRIRLPVLPRSSAR